MIKALLVGFIGGFLGLAAYDAVDRVYPEIAHTWEHMRCETCIQDKADYYQRGLRDGAR